MIENQIRELKTHKEDLYKILKDMLEWEEKNYRVVSYVEANDRNLKKLFLELHPNKVRITLLKLDTFLYFVVLQYKTFSDEITTSWIHEDLVYKERCILKNKPENISHQLITLTDLYELAEPIEDPQLVVSQSMTA